MTKVRFFRADGSLDREIEAEPGTNLLDLAQKNGQPLEGTCEGSIACSTCHVILTAADFARMSEMSEEEDDLLDLAAHVTRYSRLACQCAVPEGDPVDVKMPGESVNLENR